MKADYVCLASFCLCTGRASCACVVEHHRAGIRCRDCRQPLVLEPATTSKTRGAPR